MILIKDLPGLANKLAGRKLMREEIERERQKKRHQMKVEAIRLSLEKRCQMIKSQREMLLSKVAGGSVK